MDSRFKIKTAQRGDTPRTRNPGYTTTDPFVIVRTCPNLKPRGSRHSRLPPTRRMPTWHPTLEHDCSTSGGGAWQRHSCGVTPLRSPVADHHRTTHACLSPNAPVALARRLRTPVQRHATEPRTSGIPTPARATRAPARLSRYCTRACRTCRHASTDDPCTCCRPSATITTHQHHSQPITPAHGCLGVGMHRPRSPRPWIRPDPRPTNRPWWAQGLLPTPGLPDSLPACLASVLLPLSHSSRAGPPF